MLSPQIAPPIVASPAKRIQPLTGDPDSGDVPGPRIGRGPGLPRTQAAPDHRPDQPSHGNPSRRRQTLPAYLDQAWLRHHGRGALYSPLPKVLTLGHAYLSSTPPGRFCPAVPGPHERATARSLHNMATLEGDDILYIARSATTQRLDFGRSVGRRSVCQPIALRWAGFSLAALDDASLRDYLDHADLQAGRPAAPCTPRGVA